MTRKRYWWWWIVKGNNMTWKLPWLDVASAYLCKYLKCNKILTYLPIRRHTPSCVYGNPGRRSYSWFYAGFSSVPSLRVSWEDSSKVAWCPPLLATAFPQQLERDGDIRFVRRSFGPDCGHLRHRYGRCLSHLQNVWWLRLRYHWSDVFNRTVIAIA